MKHLQTYELFEAFTPAGVKIPEGDTWIPREHPYYIIAQPWMRKWLGNMQTLEEGDPGNEFSKIITPYGKEIEIMMDPDDGSAEYTGDGHWDVDAWGEDDWGIYYHLSGHITGVRDPDYLSDGDWEWGDEISASIGYSTFDPIKFLEKAFKKAPVIAAQLYGVLPKDKQEEADQLMQSMGIRSDLIKGGKLLGSLGV